ncbi:phosphoribosyltransferase family protein [Sorangium sp. So ce388]|uniref:phosphoribosyltransferase family protein n=1 Tax=Sorangium sp. So ce388 TaxID=3133309 RepID=UPI003F5B864F
MYLDDQVLAELGVPPEEVAEVVDRKAAEVEARVQRFRRGRPPPDLEGRTAIVVDDGIATGGTARAALRAVRRRGPRRLVLAVPVASARTLASLRPEVDELVCLYADPQLIAIGAHYQDFSQITDDHVIELLERAHGGSPGSDEEEAPAVPPGEELPVALEIDDGARLEGNLAIPAGATGLVLFAHGSGSSRHSPRNRFVAEVLQGAGLATLLLDLLTKEEEAVDERTGHLRFDVELLARRVVGAALAMRELPRTSALRLGYFGASTGAAAALIAAAKRPDLASAVVSRGGRPDLAGSHLKKVRAPTLLLVGSEDTDVLALNWEALELLRRPRQLAIVEGATHLFEEPGTLEEVARAASAWFVRHLAPRALEATA